MADETLESRIDEVVFFVEQFFVALKALDFKFA